jgi:hypothetical protein
MSRRRKVLTAIVAAGVIVLGAVTFRVLPVFTGPALPAGAARLRITTERPNLSLGCAAALLLPVRVATSGEELVLVSVASGSTISVVWPSGFAAWRIGGTSVVADPWGNIVGSDGDVLDSLGGGTGVDDAFHICPFGMVTRGEKPAAGRSSILGAWPSFPATNLVP